MKLLLKLFFAPILFILFYVGISAVFMLFPANHSTATIAHKNSLISLTHDLAHVNIVIDLSKSSLKWHTLVPELVPSMEGYLLVGWGDKATYQSTPHWGDLQASVAIKALLINTPSAMHIRYLTSITNLSASVTPLHVNQQISETIEKNVLASFDTSFNGSPTILSAGYDAGDRFYTSKGQYNLFNTCNTWVGDVLRQSGVPISSWTPFSYNVVYSIPESLRE